MVEIKGLMYHRQWQPHSYWLLQHRKQNNQTLQMLQILQTESSRKAYQTGISGVRWIR